MKFFVLFSIISVLFLIGCKQKHSNMAIRKVSDTDLFKESIPESQTFIISVTKDTVLESEAGNLIIVPLDAIVDANDEPVKDSIRLELAEASEISDLITSNLVMHAPKALVETHLAFYINATRKGKQLYINNRHPLYIEVPADRALDLYKGDRDIKGNMQWDSVIHPVKYLLTVPIDLLSFYPNGFEETVEEQLPYKNHKTLTKQLLDSLYESFAFRNDIKEGNKPGIAITADDTPTLLGKIVKRKYNKDTSDCGINPASIMAISDKKFQNTFIATREFEMRLQYVFETCNQQVLELYVNNLQKNLWEIDQMVADRLGKDHELYKNFIGFASLKQTTVKISEQLAKALASFYLNKKNKIEKKIAKLRREIEASMEKREKIFEERVEEYRSLLITRHDYRMKKFGFELKKFGWYNAATKTKLRDLDKFKINITITNGANYDRAYAYVVNPQIKSIFSMLADDKTHFNMAYAEDADLLLWEEQQFNIIGVGYINEKIAYKIGDYTQHPVVNAPFKLEDKTLSDFKKDLAVFNRGYRNENKIFVDLEFQKDFYKEKLRRQYEAKEANFRERLHRIVFRCCYGELKFAMPDQF